MLLLVTVTALIFCSKTRSSKNNAKRTLIALVQHYSLFAYTRDSVMQVSVTVLFGYIPCPHNNVIKS